MKNKLIVCIMGQNMDSHIDMCFESVKDADEIVYCDGGSSDNTIKIAKKYNAQIIENQYIKGPKMNGTQRNFYLSYLQEHYADDWVLCLDADEVVEEDGINNIRRFIKDARDGAYSVNMEHFIGDLIHVDATREKHYVGHRLFKVKDFLSYPCVEHPILQWPAEERNYKSGLCDATTIWHLSYILDYILTMKERYDNNISNSNIHDKNFLDMWFSNHIFGTYPRREVQLTDIPKVVLDKMGIDKDQFYFANRGLETKHFLMARQWNEYFKPKSVLELGCGRAPYGYAFDTLGVKYTGFELSNHAVNTAFLPIKQGDITKNLTDEKFDLVMVIDVLEHLDDEQLDKAMKQLLNYGNNFLFSVPVIGDPNLMNDKTHKQFKTRKDWIKYWEKNGLEILAPQKDWFFKEQLFIGRKI